MTSQAFTDRFVLLSHRKVGGGQKTGSTDVTTWRRSDGATIRVAPRSRVKGLHFLTNSNERLFSGKQGTWGLFLDVEILAGDSPELRAELRTLLPEVDERPWRFRAAREPLWPRDASSGYEIDGLEFPSAEAVA